MKDCCSDEKSCCPNHSQHDECHSGKDKQEMKTDYFLEIADCAWSEVLKDKIKEHILATQNERMTELAKIIAEANNQRWRAKKEKMKACADFQEKLSSFYSHFKK